MTDRNDRRQQLVDQAKAAGYEGQAAEDAADNALREELAREASTHPSQPAAPPAEFPQASAPPVVPTRTPDDPTAFTVGQVVAYEYPESGTGRPLTRVGIVAGVIDAPDADGHQVPGYVVGWFTELSHPIPGDGLLEVT